ncbi:MAG TPA: type II toxin-antitoxin system prevent-host-death family antitoxin [Stellaceae bacterium]|jgi:antitoxin (DNA-binding transcriptional repressor) of toxin-antitoxin stability system|nr:type II toxin-antitoxin system prevent-host-death family antitoxin [Stellaceae bacterium]
MRTVGLKVLKNKLSEYVRLAAAGETVVVTDRGRAVAEIGPPHQDLRLGEGRPLSAFELRGMREGWLTPAKVRDGSPPPSKPVEGLTFEQLMADLERDREDRR